jgi:hypothetical protein
MTRKVIGTITIVVALVIGLASAASAFFTASATGTQLASSATLSSPSTVTATASGATGLTVAVTTSASTPAPTGFTIYPHGSTTSAACTINGSSGSCSVSGLTAGSTTAYDVYSTLGNWISSSSSPVSGTTTPAKPTGAVFGGSGKIGPGNKSNAEIDVTLPTTSSSSDTVHVTVSDGTTTITVPVKPGTNGSGTVAFTGIDLSSLHDGPLTVTAWSTNAGGSSGNVTASAVKDTVAPTVTLTAPTAGSTTSSLTPTFSGTAGTQAADSAHSADSSTVTVKVYAGSSASGTAVQTLTASVGADGSWSVPASSALTAGTQYTAVALQSDAAGSTGTSSAVTFTAGPLGPVALKFVSLSGWWPLAIKGYVELVDVNGDPVANALSGTLVVTVIDSLGDHDVVHIQSGDTTTWDKFTVYLPLFGWIYASATYNGQTIHT